MPVAYVPLPGFCALSIRGLGSSRPGSECVRYQLNSEPVNIDVVGRMHLQLNYAVECDATGVGPVRMGECGNGGTWEWGGCEHT